MKRLFFILLIPAGVYAPFQNKTEWQIAGDRYGVNPDTLSKLCWIESNHKHRRGYGITTSSAGAIGICQMKPATARMMGCGDIRLKRQNIECAAKYLSLIQRTRCWRNKGQDVCLARFYHDGHASTRLSREGRRHIERFKAARITRI